MKRREPKKRHTSLTQDDLLVSQCSEIFGRLKVIVERPNVAAKVHQKGNTVEMAVRRAPVQRCVAEEIALVRVAAVWRKKKERFRSATV